MTEPEMRAATNKLLIAKQNILEKIALEARAVIPVLLDAGRTNSAKALQELLFEYDAKEQEFHELVMKDPAAMLRSILSDVRGRTGV